MSFLMATGATMAVASCIGMVKFSAKAHLKRTVEASFMSTDCLSLGKGPKRRPVRLSQVRRTGNVYTGRVKLPYNVTEADLEKHRKALEQATASYIRFKQIHGPTYELQFGYEPFSGKMNYSDSLPVSGLSIPFFTPFGLRLLDFADETNCHMLLGGATRMGKSVFLRLVATHLIKSTKGKIKILFIDHKVTDLYMFRDVPQIKIAETQGEAKVFLQDLLEEAYARKELLKRRGDVVDLKDLRAKYPNESVDPIFIIFDEYGRFADNESVQELVMEFAETAGYLDIHLVISSQRPDAKDVLKPRIKANILTRLSFATFDETNSKIILDVPDAAHIGKTQGKAVLVDGFPEVVQVPYISSAQAIAILKEFRRIEYVTEGLEDHEITEAVPGLVEGSISGVDLPGDSPAIHDSEPGAETHDEGRLHSIGAASERPPIFVHAEPDDYTSGVAEDYTLPRPSGCVHKAKPAKNIRSGASRKR